MSNSHRAGKPFVVNQRREAGEVINSIPRYTLCRACWKQIAAGQAYCSTAHQQLHQRLAS